MVSRVAARTALLTLLIAGVAAAFEPAAGDFAKSDPGDIRVLTYNHGRNFIADGALDDVFARILTVLAPDVICFQEFTSSVSDDKIAVRLSELLPPGPGGAWHVHSGQPTGIRTVLASRFPLSMTRRDTVPPASTRGVTIALVDLPDATYGVDLYLLGVHLKCCGNPGGSEDAKRQASADAIANWMGDARDATRRDARDLVSLPPGTPMLALGDFNMVGGPQPERTLLTGDIQNEPTYGPDVRGDWDESTLLDVTPPDPFTGDTFTWQGNDRFPPGRLDRLFLTDSVVSVAERFLLNTNTMSAPALAATGLKANDTLPSRASDHLPLVVDLRLADRSNESVAETSSQGLTLLGIALLVGLLVARGHRP